MYKHMIRGILILSMIVVPALRACHYQFDAKADQVKVGQPIEVKVTVILEHRRCDIEMSDTRFNLSKLELVKESEWIEEKRGTFSKSLTLKPVETGTGKLEVIRECTKKGISADTWSVNIGH